MVSVERILRYADIYEGLSSNRLYPEGTFDVAPMEGDAFAEMLEDLGVSEGDVEEALRRRGISLGEPYSDEEIEDMKGLVLDKYMEKRVV